MSNTNNAPRRRTGGRQQALAVGAGPDTTLPPIARPVIVITRGRIETAVRCPGCDDWHRHVGFGERHAPCGAVYRVMPRRGRAAA
jgi:hypothetical protein